MSQAQPGSLLRIHVSESDRLDGKPLYEAIVAKCREMKIAGATVLRGLEGYGETAEIHKSHGVRHDRPVIVMIVDSGEKLRGLMPAIERMMDTGVLAISDVDVIRVQKKAAGEDGKAG